MQLTATGRTRPKPSMPPSRKHHNRIRDLVLQSAGRLFNRHGFNAVSIDDVMAEAGLTRGSFYCYFSSKSDLYAQSVARAVHEDRENPKVSGSERTRADKIVHDEAALRLMIQSFEQAANGNAETRRANALAIAALCVGGMVLSRSIDDRKLGDELRGAAKTTALSLGKW